MCVSRRIAALAAVTTLAGALASCSGAGPATPAGSAGQRPFAQGPVVTLRVAVYGSPGYRQAGLFAAYQRLHPGIRIVEDVTGQEAGYWQALRRHLATGRGLDDLVAIPLAQMSAAVHWTTGTSNSTTPPANTGLHVSVSGCSGDLGVATSLAKVYEYYAAKSGDTTAETDAQNILDVIHKDFADSLGYSAPETRTDYKNFTPAYSTTNFEGVFIPSNWTGKYPGGIPLSSSTNTFLSIRPWYIGDPQWSKVQAYLNGGSAPAFNYHRFWAEVDIATASETFASLFPSAQPPSGS